MGNQSSQPFKRKEKISYHVNLLKMHTKVDLDVKFEQSSYNIMEQRFKPVPMMDKSIRDSEFCIVQSPQLSQYSLWQIKIYLKRNLCDTTYVQLNNTWRMIKYSQGGHFLEHCDRQKQLEGLIHFGTQIFIPPTSLIPHQGGELILIDEQDKKQVIASPFMWTHVIIPLGVKHQVNNVTEGFRISYVKEIWIEDQYDIETDQDRWARQHQQDRRNQIYKQQQKRIKNQRQQWMEKRWKNRKNWPRGHLD